MLMLHKKILAKGQLYHVLFFTSLLVLQQYCQGCFINMGMFTSYRMRYHELFLLYLKCFLINFFYHHLSPLYPLPPLPSTIPPNHHILVHVHEFFLFFSIPSPQLRLSELESCSLSISLSLVCLLVQFVHQIPHKSEIIS